MEIKRLSYKHKNNKLAYYCKNYIRLYSPKYFQRKKYDQLIKSDFNNEYINDRVLYYNNLSKHYKIPPTSKCIKHLSLKDGSKTYIFDFKEYTRYFDCNLLVNFEYGDVTTIPKQPSFVKSRPICDDNSNSILLKWNKIRHFTFVKNDRRQLSEKKNQLVFRGRVRPSLKNRIQFIEKYIDHPLCNVGSIDKNNIPAHWVVKRMTIEEQLKYKFILSLEGNDVASNLKWIMSSNSVAVMRRPRFETWFMEARLIPDYHYILIKDDYSDLEEKLLYYTKRIEELEQIRKNANAYVKQFQNKKTEDLISLMVIKKYFEQTNQL